jgi:hypothetical protein
LPQRDAATARGNSFHWWAADPHQLTQFCCATSSVAPRKLHQAAAELPIDRVVAVSVRGVLIAVRQPGLRLAFFSCRQATILLMFGISEEHKRKTSGVHAARSSAVPTARLDVAYDTRPSTKTNAQDHAIVRLFTASPLAIGKESKKDYPFVERRSRAPCGRDLPLIAAVFLRATIHSAQRYRQGKGGRWKGRAQVRKFARNLFANLSIESLQTWFASG